MDISNGFIQRFSNFMTIWPAYRAKFPLFYEFCLEIDGNLVFYKDLGSFIIAKISFFDGFWLKIDGHHYFIKRFASFRTIWAANRVQ